MPLYTAKAFNKFVSPVLAFFRTLDPDENQLVLKLFENEGHSRASTFMALCNRVFFANLFQFSVYLDLKKRVKWQDLYGRLDCSRTSAVGGLVWLPDQPVCLYADLILSLALKKN